MNEYTQEQNVPSVERRLGLTASGTLPWGRPAQKETAECNQQRQQTESQPGATDADARSESRSIVNNKIPARQRHPQHASLCTNVKLEQKNQEYLEMAHLPSGSRVASFKRPLLSADVCVSPQR